ncbi:uncharacterized protein LOC126988686 [Eriocheir sinensis]|uniref:uncharacterized protein LOC126988685 n=1 Tax=Eriocheir sinensis TaxID=95602 RepID=UPI0021C65D70|nr:uncharacterized protein LOC126988685 [Eriocheir sinensis]XP_050702997.1 uncharacterized protein LOC126988686 [Eriocheir sinensis]
MMKGLFPIALIVATTLADVSGSVLVATGLSAAGLAAGGLAVGALAVGAKLLVLKAKRRRHGREAAPSCVSFDNPEMYFALAANGDFLDCGRRFVCELEATPDENLAQEERLIRNLFGQDSVAVNSSAAEFYAEAGRLGAVEGMDACAATFSRCPFDRKTIFLEFKEAQAAQ